MSEIDYSEIRNRWVTEGAESDIGLWWLADDLREALGAGATEQAVRTATLEVLRPLLEKNQLRTVTLQEGGTFEVWPGTVDEILARIESGWEEVGSPDIGDVAWFIGERCLGLG